MRINPTFKFLTMAKSHKKGLCTFELNYRGSIFMEKERVISVISSGFKRKHIYSHRAATCITWLMSYFNYNEHLALFCLQ